MPELNLKESILASMPVGHLSDQTLAEHGLLFQSGRIKKSHKKANLTKNLYLFSVAQEMTRELGKNGIRVVSLKGMSLLTSIYKKDKSLRAISDIDVLINSYDLVSVRKWLRENGYNKLSERKFYANAHKETWTLNSDLGEVVIELHTKLLSNEKLNNTWEAELTEDGIWRLQPEEEFFYLVSHLAHQHTFLKLFWLNDLDLFVKCHTLNWGKVESLAKRFKRKRSLDATLYILKNLLGHKDIPSCKEKFWRHLLTWPKLIDSQKNRTNYLMLKHLLKDSLFEAFRYDVSWLASKSELTKPRRIRKSSGMLN